MTTWSAAWSLAVIVCSTDVDAAEPAPAPAERPAPHCKGERPRHAWYLSDAPSPPCRPKPKPPARAPLTLRPPRDGVALKLSALVALGSEARAGFGVEGGVSYFGEHLELGVGVLLMALWASESGFHDLYESENERGPRENRDLVLMPRLKLSTWLESTGFFRAHASGVFGPAWLRAEGGDAQLADVGRSIWSYVGGIGLSGGIVHAQADLFGYMASAEQFEWDLLSTTHHDLGNTRGAPGFVVSLSLVIPIALSGEMATAPGTEPRPRPPRPPSAWRPPRRR
jgi:hypothetical protein